MSIAIKPSWNPTTIALTALALVIEWPLALPVAAYAIWGDRLVGPQGNFTDLLAKAGPWLNGSAKAQTSTSPAADAWRSERLKDLEKQRQEIDAELAAFRHNQAERAKAQDQAAFDQFQASRSQG